MLHAGLPAQYWNFALNCVTHNLNIEDVEGDGDSAWKRMTGDDFKGKAIPFGAKVFFKPTDTRGKTYGHKFDPKGIPAIFAGYVVATGRSWSRKYRVWDMKEFANVNLSMDAAVPRKLAQPYQTEVIHFPKEITFPLKAEYERMNETIEGLKDKVDLDGKEIKGLDDDDDSLGRPGGGGGGNDGLDDDRPPPDPGEDPDLADVDWSGDEGPDEHGGGDEGDPIDAIGDKILERAEREASGTTPLPPPAATHDSTDGRRSHDEVGPSGRLSPKGDSEEPGELIKILREKKLAPKERSEVLLPRDWKGHHEAIVFSRFVLGVSGRSLPPQSRRCTQTSRMFSAGQKASGLEQLA